MMITREKRRLAALAGWLGVSAEERTARARIRIAGRWKKKSEHIKQSKRNSRNLTNAWTRYRRLKAEAEQAALAAADQANKEPAEKPK